MGVREVEHGESGRKPIRSYRDLEVWQMAMDLSVVCYRLTASFPREEQFGLTSQIRRSAASIPANIAEGNGRESTKDYIRFLRMSQGSLKELETHLILAERISMLDGQNCGPTLEMCDRIGRMIRSLIRSLERTQ